MFSKYVFAFLTVITLALPVLAGSSTPTNMPPKTTETSSEEKVAFSSEVAVVLNELHVCDRIVSVSEVANAFKRANQITVKIPLSDGELYLAEEIISIVNHRMEPPVSIPPVTPEELAIVIRVLNNSSLQ